MARFYFDINEGQGQVEDVEGQELASPEDARQMALKELGLIIRDELPDGDRGSFVVTVRDDGGIPVYVAMATIIGEWLG